MAAIGGRYALEVQLDGSPLAECKPAGLTYHFLQK